MCDRCGTGLTFFGLAEPQLPLLDSYAEALRHGWIPDGFGGEHRSQLAALEADPTAFLASLADDSAEAQSPPVSDGNAWFSRVRWMWDGEFCGTARLRYAVSGSSAARESAGHLDLWVVPHKRRHGYATRAFKHILGEARDLRLPKVEILAQADDVAAKRILDRWGAHPDGHAKKPAAAGPAISRYIVDLG